MNVTISMDNVLNILHAMALTSSNKQWLGERLLREAQAETASVEASTAVGNQTGEVISEGPLKGFRRMRKEDLTISPTVAQLFGGVGALPEGFDVKRSYGDYLAKKYR